MTSTNGAFVVVAARNEALVLDEVLEELLTVDGVAGIVVVDDGSVDGTYDIAASRPVHALRHSVNLGQGAALKTGITYALQLGAEIVVTFDGDGQMEAADVPAIVAPVASGESDVALGTRFASHNPEGITRSRKLTLFAARLFTRLTTRLPVTDAHNGFRAFSRGALQRMTLTQDRMAHASEILSEISRLSLRWTEVPVRIRYTHYSRQKGQSSWGGALDILLDLFFGKR